MSPEPRPLYVVVASQNVALLHEISWVLEAVGYKVQTTNDLDQDALWRRYSLADMVIVDGRNVAEPTAATFAHESENPVYRIFLYDAAMPTDFAAWYAAGAHDALRTPVSRGELLARVRTGARFLEFERRLQHQSSRCAVPGMLSRRGFVRKLRKLVASEDFAATQQVLLVASIDWYAGIRRKNGETAGRNLLQSAARAIKRVAGDTAATAYLGDGRFAALLVGQPQAAAKGIAETLGKDFGCRESHHESIPRPTLSSAIVPWSAGTNAEKFLSDALETLELAEHTGGDCVVVHGEFNQDLADWQEEMSSGNPFTHAVAQDIMEPFPAVLERDAPHSELAEALCRSGVPLRPYVDGDGRLVGVATDVVDTASTGNRRSGGPTAATITKPDTISSDAGFPEIYEAFASRGCASLVVTADDRPLGYLTFDGFLSMIDPIHTDSFAATGKSVDELAYLVVPSVAGEPSEEPEVIVPPPFESSAVQSPFSAVK